MPDSLPGGVVGGLRECSAREFERSYGECKKAVFFLLRLTVALIDCRGAVGLHEQYIERLRLVARHAR